MFHVKRFLRFVSLETTLLELTARSVNVSPARVADRGFDTVLRKATLKLFDLRNRRRFERAVFDIIQLDEVDVAKCSLAELNKCMGNSR